MAEPVPALAFHNLSKTFGGQRALDGVDFAVRPGEVHGLLGQNGSGKSTLIKVLAGYHAPDPGSTLLIRGVPVPLPLAPGRFHALGISFVHQHLGLVPTLTVTENLLAGRLAASRSIAVSLRREARRATAVFARYGLAIDPMAPVARLSAVERALLAIVRAMEELDAFGHGGAGVLVLDEPTPFLPRHDVEELFRLVRAVVARGASVIFVSHDVDEVLEITDRATVLRDGRVAGTVTTQGTAKDALVQLIIGRALGPVARSVAVADRAPRARVEGLGGAVLDSLSLTIGRGEIVGLTGLLGSGYEEVPYLLYGGRQAARGRLELDGVSHDLARMTPAAALASRIVLIPGDRAGAGAIGSLPVVDNVTMPLLGGDFAAWWLGRGRMKRHAEALGRRFEVVPNRPALPLSALSGGNAQKVVLAKWLQTDPVLILLDEPTQGVDIGARFRLFDGIRAAAAAGACVICASSDNEQLAAICDRVLVLSRGRVVAELGAGLTRELITESCYRTGGGDAALGAAA